MFPKLVLVLYCILFLHQTTTRLYTEMDSYRCIASSFYIKPQLKRSDMFIIIVVLHPLSTSNHNLDMQRKISYMLYCILFLHQTTTNDEQ